MVYGEMVSKVCSRSQGQPVPAVRSRAISSTKSANGSPEDVRARGEGSRTEVWPAAFKAAGPRDESLCALVEAGGAPVGSKLVVPPSDGVFVCRVKVLPLPAGFARRLSPQSICRIINIMRNLIWTWTGSTKPDFQLHPVIRRLDPGRQPALELAIVEID